MAVLHTISAVQHGLAIRDLAVVAEGCQRIHDADELKLKARLPAPQADHARHRCPRNLSAGP
jgi:hypothetical protein